MSDEPQIRSYKVPWFFTDSGEFYIDAFDADQAMVLARDELDSCGRRAQWSDDGGELWIDAPEEWQP